MATILAHKDNVWIEDGEGCGVATARDGDSGRVAARADAVTSNMTDRGPTLQLVPRLPGLERPAGVLHQRLDHHHQGTAVTGGSTAGGGATLDLRGRHRPLLLQPALHHLS